ncbi:hypothetical protein BMH52_05110 [Pseudomonas sp. BTN1]|nr:hypothetical protein BMH52_05110 [Pseudomonas sp. BTN1]SFX46937.1 hypothetical protein SAMN03159316_1755 [Pseudomonas sp. NFR02]
MSLSLDPTPSLSLPLAVATATSNTQAQATPASSPPTPKAVQPDETALLKAYLEAVQRKVLHGNAGLITVPPQSTLGQWLGLYRMHVENAVVQGWLREQHFAPDTLLSINPSTGTLSAEIEGKTKTFHLSDTSGWGQISGPLLETAKVIAPGNNGDLRVRLGKDSIQVSAKVVANFEGVSLPQTLSQARTQIRYLEHKDSFDPIPANDRLRPASSRSSQALQVQTHNAANYYSTAPQALAYKRLAVDVANNLPNTRAEAKKWADDLLLKLTGKPIDSDTVYLNRFKGGESADTATGWEHTFQEPWSSLRLPDALLKNFSEHDWVPGNLDLEAGLYTQPAGQSEKGGYGKHNQIDLKPSQVMHESWKTDFQSQMTQKIDNFWNSHSDSYQTAIKGEFTFQARKQFKTAQAWPAVERALQAPEHQFTRDDYKMVMAAVPDLPLDENAPISVDQLKAKTPIKAPVQANALSIHGFTSSDIVRFSAGDGGRQVLYIPGAEPAFLRFDSAQKLEQWLIDQAKDPKKSEALASHFPMIYRQDQTAGFAARAAKVLMPLLWFTHVGETKDGLDTHLKKMASGELKGPAIDASHSKITGDLFTTLATTTQERMKSDADVVIKSNSEETRDTWLNDITVAAGLLAKLAPIAAPVAAVAVVTGLTELALGAEKTSSGDTVQERDEGASKAFDGLLNTLFSVGASSVPEDPFALPPEKELPLGEPITPTPANEVAEPQPGPSRGTSAVKPAPQPLPDSRSLIPLAKYAVPEGEALIKNATRDALGVYRMTDDTGAFRQFVRLTDETGTSKVFEISGRYRTGDAFAKVINPDNGAGLMVITPGRNGEWARAPGDGGIKWPWNLAVSPPPPSTEMKISPKISDNFVGLEGEKLPGAERFDELLKNSGRQNFDFSIRNVNSKGIDKTKLEVSWEVPDNNFAVSETERAGPADYGTSEYSDQFVKDTNRSTYRVEVKTGGAPQTAELNQGGATTEDIRRARITQFETLIPDPDLRARISEVAHQGAMADVSAGFMSLEDTELKEGFRLKVDNTSYTIVYDPTSEVTEVNAIGIGHIQDTERGIDPVPGIEVTLTKRFKILATNDVSEPFKIDQSAPARASLMVMPLPEENELRA